MKRDNLQVVVDEIRADLRATRGCLYRIEWPDGRKLWLEVVADGWTSIRMWKIDDGPLSTDNVDPEAFSDDLYVWIRAVMRRPLAAELPS